MGSRRQHWQCAEDGQDRCIGTCTAGGHFSPMQDASASFALAAFFLLGRPAARNCADRTPAQIDVEVVEVAIDVLLSPKRA
jgi:hypothetical protein